VRQSAEPVVDRHRDAGRHKRCRSAKKSRVR
jgi:hypothetical protein